MTEPAATGFVPHVVLAGDFQGADDFRFGSGSALLIATGLARYVLRLEEFSIRYGPDHVVQVSSNLNGWCEDGLNPGVLRATDGSHKDDVPAGIDISRFQSVVSWRPAFAVLFSPAPLM